MINVWLEVTMNTLLGRRAACAALALTAVLPALPAGEHAQAVAAPPRSAEVAPNTSHESPAAPPVVEIRYRSKRERRFVRHVVRHTYGVTPLEARWAWRHSQYWRNRLPYSWSDSSWATKSSPAVVGTADSSVSYCTVTTIRRVKSRWGFTMMSLKMVQTWGYDQWRVYPQTARLYSDVVGIYDKVYRFDGVTLSNDFYIPVSGKSIYAVHQSDRLGRFVAADFFGGFGGGVAVKIEKWYNGDWATYTDVGWPGCQDFD
jgi:hypothetical protein